MLRTTKAVPSAAASRNPKKLATLAADLHTDTGDVSIDAGGRRYHAKAEWHPGNCDPPEDMVRARAFYEGVLGLEPIYNDNRLSAYAVAGREVLLVFRKGTTGERCVTSGTIPGHGGDGALLWRSLLARTNSIIGRRISPRGDHYRRAQ